MEPADLEQLGVVNWAPLPDGRLFASLEDDGVDNVRFDMILNWTWILKRLVPLPKQVALRPLSRSRRLVPFTGS